jgi:hypothetical protein
MSDDSMKAATVEHTPTPWEVHEVEDSGEVVSRGMRQVGGKGINKGEEFELFDKADADFIVRAVNAHDDLLAAARMALARLVLPEHEYARQYEGNVLMRLDAAIAKAAGR